MNRPYQILICDDDILIHTQIKQILKTTSSQSGLEFSVSSALSTTEAMDLLAKVSIDILLLDIHLSRADEGFTLIPQALEQDPDLAIIMMSSLSDFKSIQKAIRLGAMTILTKDSEPAELVHTLKQALQRNKLLRRHQQYHFEAKTTHPTKYLNWRKHWNSLFEKGD